MNLVDHPLTLWIGSASFLNDKALKELQCFFCLHNACGRCTDCKKIVAHQHHAVIWIEPEKAQYGSAQVEAILEEAAFMLDEGEKRFIVITQADCFTLSAAHRLLKVMEEPPRGYYFILLAENKERILPTIISRALVTEFVQEHGENRTELFALFTKNSDLNFYQATQIIEKAQLNDHEAQAFAYDVLNYYVQRLRKSDQNPSEGADFFLIKRIQEFLKNSPMPGSAKIFLRTLFLKIKT